MIGDKMMQQDLSCTANKWSTKSQGQGAPDLERGNKYLNAPNDVSFEHPEIVCGKSLFDEALCAEEDETLTATTATRENYNLDEGRFDQSVARHQDYMDQMDRDGVWQGDDDLDDSGGVSETPVPKPYRAFGPVPIPIQHSNHANSLQRPATQFVSHTSGQDIEVVQDEGGRRRSCLRHRRGGGAGGGSSRPKSLNQLIAAIRNRQTTDVTVDASLQRRLHDFERARHMRRDRFQSQPPLGVMGMYEHLSGIRVDLRWAEQSAVRRANGESYIGWADYVKENETNKYQNRPYFIILIALLSTMMMIYTMYLSDWVFAPIDVNPMIGPPPEILLEAGALNSYLLIVEDQWWRLFTPMVLHAGIIHFSCNMLAIWLVGGALEKIHGFYNISCLFIISAVGGNILSAVFQPNVISVGASGGIFGLLGVCLADVFVNWDLLFLRLEDEEAEQTTWNHIKVLLWLFLDIIINVVIGLTPYVDNYAHLGGLLYGIFYALPLVDRLGIHFFGQLGFCFQIKSCSLRLFGFMAGCALLLSSSLLLLKSDGQTSPCESCRFISCAPFPFWKEDKWWDC